MGTEPGKAHEHEFDAVMARCGHDVPADLRPGALAVYLELTRMAARLRQPRAAESEPSNVFNVRALLRDR
ncbi:hypothetical protein LZ198_26490 [Myxococcus sp. K15C18031901]|uniref:hypothetical protein n=1 Tax=Myxococcus dinghuensis TaxID=2906761 RepID=UPI0020A7F8CA|nr:hypothetical protein [Myxococcus dinghuensis]MCP3102426.1 hypothetical protein [Myxococcus dinghuensis]